MLFVTHAAPYPLQLLTLLLKERQYFELNPRRLLCLMLVSILLLLMESLCLSYIICSPQEEPLLCFVSRNSHMAVSGHGSNPRGGKEAKAPGCACSRLHSMHCSRSDSLQLLWPYEGWPLQSIHHRVIMVILMT